MNIESTVATIPFNQIHIPGDENIRSELPKIKELAEHINVHGLIEPLVVVNGGEGDKPYRLLAGFRRAAALKLLKWGSKPVNVTIREEWNPLVMFGENVREGLHPLDAAQRIYDLTRAEYPHPEGVEVRPFTLEEIAKAADTSISSIRTYIRIHEHLASSVRKAARKRADVPLRTLHACALEGAYLEDVDENGKKVKTWEPNENKQLRIFSKWKDAKEALEEEGRSRAPRGEGGGSESEPEDKDGYEAGSKDKIKGGKNHKVIEAAIRILQSKKEEDELHAARADALRFALGEIQRLPGVTKAELEETLKAMKVKAKKEEEEVADAE